MRRVNAQTIVNDIYQHVHTTQRGGKWTQQEYHWRNGMKSSAIEATMRRQKFVNFGSLFIQDNGHLKNFLFFSSSSSSELK